MLFININGTIYKFCGSSKFNFRSNQYFYLFYNLVKYLLTHTDTDICEMILYIDSILKRYEYLILPLPSNYWTVLEMNKFYYNSLKNTKLVFEPYNSSYDDIISLLYEKNLLIILNKIYSYCDDRDLFNIINVCDKWKQISKLLVPSRIKFFTKQFENNIVSHYIIDEFDRILEKFDEPNLIYLEKISNTKVKYFQIIDFNFLDINELFEKQFCEKKLIELDKSILFFNIFE
jgi:hypothetical protein